MLNGIFMLARHLFDGVTFVVLSGHGLTSLTLPGNLTLEGDRWQPDAFQVTVRARYACLQQAGTLACYA
ncbi:hypothetical protein ACFLSV_04060 [Bacteroidota bacterium]